MEKRWIVVEISTDLLLQALAFPSSCEVVACNGEDAPLGQIKLVVSHPDLPVVEDGQPIPMALPVITQVAEQPPAHFYTFDWGV